jgi:hypothetical protein
VRFAVLFLLIGLSAWAGIDAGFQAGIGMFVLGGFLIWLIFTLGDLASAVFRPRLFEITDIVGREYEEGHPIVEGRSKRVR